MVFSNFLKNLGNCIKFSNLTVLLSKKGLTMPLTVATNKERRDNLVSGGGLKPNTFKGDRELQKILTRDSNFSRLANLAGFEIPAPKSREISV